MDNAHRAAFEASCNGILAFIAGDAGAIKNKRENISAFLDIVERYREEYAPLIAAALYFMLVYAGPTMNGFDRRFAQVLFIKGPVPVHDWLRKAASSRGGEVPDYTVEVYIKVWMYILESQKHSDCWLTPS